MAKTNTGDKQFIGAIDDSMFTNRGDKATLANTTGGEGGYAKRTNSPNAKPEVIKVTFDRLEKPTKS